MHYKAIEWKIRLYEEIKDSTSAYFLTLTYNDENLYFNEKGKPSVFKRHVQNYMKSIRKISDNRLRYFCIGEYGGKFGRPHYHMNLFNLEQNKLDEIVEKWKFGNVHVGQLNEARIQYTASYHTLKYNKPDRMSNDTFVLMSRNKGIGYKYVERMKKYHTDNYFTQKSFYAHNDIKLPLPQYYKDKIYNDEQKQLFRLQAENIEVKNWQNYRERQENFKHDFLDMHEFESQQLWSDYRAYMRKNKKNQKL